MSPGDQMAAGNVNSFNVSTNHNNIVNIITETDTEEDQILQWLSPLEPQRRHQAVRTGRLDSIGNWVLSRLKLSFPKLYFSCLFTNKFCFINS